MTQWLRLTRGVARIFPWGRSDFFLEKFKKLEKCSLLVDKLGHTSECYIEVQQKWGGGLGPFGPPSGYAPLYTSYRRTAVHTNVSEVTIATSVTSVTVTVL